MEVDKIVLSDGSEFHRHVFKEAFPVERMGSEELNEAWKLATAYTRHCKKYNLPANLVLDGAAWNVRSFVEL